MGIKTKTTEDLILRLPNEMIRVIDKRRKDADDLPSRQEVIRRILQKEFALELAAQDKPLM